ncbi:STP4 (YDL048C) and STP3 (YLR375W) [Zygosaccharomyces parabailii]|nr:STP4 (YDL048C) and STP3 (YLR375W) [Zygosaccharomyces parabailii]
MTATMPDVPMLHAKQQPLAPVAAVAPTTAVAAAAVAGTAAAAAAGSAPAPSLNSSSTAPHVTLPPISSFDSLIRAAENQYQPEAVLSYQLSTAQPPVNNTVPRIVSRRNTATSSSRLGSLSPGGMRSPSLSPLMSSSGSVTSGANGTAGAAISTAGSSGSAMAVSGSVPVGVVGSSTSVSAAGPIHKPRKKKECPICHNFYANLSTHKSTHLTPENRPHKCPVCQRGFARNNDLVRHKKRHWKDEIVEINAATHGAHGAAASSSSSLSSPESSDDHHHLPHLDERDQLRSLHQIKGTFKCPFNSSLIQLDMEVYPYKSKPLGFETSNCHQTGVFSRCDTFKNHLKALHFEYPPGTKKRDRSVVPGRCKHCGLRFPNVDVWLNEHVGKACGYAYH